MKNITEFNISSTNLKERNNKFSYQTKDEK